MKHLFLYMLIAFLVLPALSQPVRVIISGRIVSAKTGEALNGATIKVMNEKTATSSLADGSFKISVPLNAVISVSFIGYSTKQVTAAANQAALVITLDELIAEQQEVVVSTGYQTIPKERATGAFTKIDNELLNRRVSTDILSRLEGVANSVLFDRRAQSIPTISVRGRSTIFSNNSPLIVLDNFPYEGNINNINPNDIESITILRDAAAASIWGTRAGNGVIVITTKKGQYNQPTRMELNTNATIDTKPDVFSLKTISSADMIDVEKILFGKGYYTSTENSTSHAALSPVVELLIKKRDGVLSAADADTQIEALKGKDVRNDYKNYLYQNAFKQQYGLNIRGGGQKMLYAFSAGIDKNVDNLAVKYDRISLRSDNTYAVTKNLEVSIGLTYTQSTSKAGKPAYNAITTGSGRPLYPYAQLADDNGHPVAITRDYRSTFIQQAQAKGLLNWEYKPLDDYKYIDNNLKIYDILLNAGLRYKFVKALFAEVKFQNETSITNGSNNQGIGSYVTRDVINRFTQVDAAGKLTYPVPVGAILDINQNILISNSVRGQINYNNTWGKNNIAAIAGSEVRQITVKSSAFRTYGYNDELLTYSQPDYVSQFIQYNNAGSSARVTDNSGFTETINRFISFYVNAAYTYNNRYTFSVSGRKDGSNLFGAETNRQVVPLWSSGFNWNIAKEKFYKVYNLPDLKLRITYGYNGNVNNLLSAYTIIRYYTANNNTYIIAPFADIYRLPDSKLRWETTSTLNLGVDFSNRNEIVSGSLDVYKKKGYDLFGDAPFDPTIGFPSGKIRRNIANMESKGIDLQLHANIINKTFKWATDMLFNYNADKVTSYDSISPNASSYTSSGGSIIPLVGKPLYSIFSYRWAGLDPATGDPQGYYNGAVSKDYLSISSKSKVSDLVYNGPALPPYFGSLRNTFSYKNFSLSANITYRFGYYFKRQSISYSGLYSNWTGNADFAARWQKPGDELNTNVPSMIYPSNANRDAFYVNSEVLVIKADNIRLQDINLSYLFPLKQTKIIRQLRVYLYANNVGILWKANTWHIDPDYGSGVLPLPFSFSAGIKASF